MIRKPSLLITIFISIFLMPLPVYAFSGMAHNGSGGHGSSGGRGLGGRGFGGHGSFSSSGFGRYSNFSSYRGFNTGHFVQRHFSNPNQAHFDHGRFDHHDHGRFFSSFDLGFGFGAIFPFVAYYPFIAYPYYSYPYYGYPYYDYPYDYPYPGSYPPDDYVDPYASYPPSDQPYGDLETQVAPDDQSYGDLEIQVAPEDVEIYVDGRFVGMANDFNGSTTISVPSGTHKVEFRHNGSSTSTDVTIAPDSKSVIREEFSNSYKNPI
jgi:hypothetical protein